jgi:hypothetical protein
MRTDRRSFLLGSAGVLAAGVAASLQGPSISEAKSGSGKNLRPALPAPKPIPAGETIPGLVIHELLAGPENIVLPFTGLQLIGLNVEPSTITDFNGVTALAYHTGTATDSNGILYNLETDIRVMEGEYIGEDGNRHRGAFAEM